MRAALIFPGQGSQFLGMGRDLMQISMFKKRMQQVAASLQLPLDVLVDLKSKQMLLSTEIIQPYIFGISVALYEMMCAELSFQPLVVAGHSLGEYAALVAGGVLSFETGLQMVRLRGKYMSLAADKGQWKMAAVLGLSAEVVADICEEARHTTGEILRIANYNSPTQMVISGSVKAVEHASKLASERNAFRIAPLQVSGAFHTEAMQEANIAFLKVWSKEQLSSPKLPIVMNATGTQLTEVGDIDHAMRIQMISPVQWASSVRTIFQYAPDCLIEIGPGRVLSGLVKSMDRSQQILNVGNIQEWNMISKKLKPIHTA
ncbi:[acyl-carrier-protein] S-malonyltransferase [Paenibacillus shirakamiensis]|uniref:Malonyl CoA-acyl carrier protein transacylase n=1 Tax=Paenibacillus shirakamiensis TaxID=1265935 RepID=A0ABS4JHM0_9BACL|nr:ACP S-malonyltransferase [Paenibacillus shirakamiensis]MBP2000456.1 [acyl-carrier-protein] S-malonyltransferase [Paenibacillus shirakamiensis]